eukprot:13928512-Ditylum_brightwellii.AAC.1
MDLLLSKEPPLQFSDLHAHKGWKQNRFNLAPRTVPQELPGYCPPKQSTYDAANAVERICNTKDANASGFIRRKRTGK